MIQPIVLLGLVSLVFSQVPPVWPAHFSQDFVETYASNKFATAGKLYYDWDRQASVLFRLEGRNQGFCGSVLNVTGPCIQLVKNQKRYVIHPERQSCCVCCDADHGCGILKRDWLSGAKYLGKDTISGESFDKFSIPDGNSMDYYWATTDGKAVPRRMTEVDSRFKDFIMNTYSEAPIDPAIFALPSYCKETLCPDTSFCSFFRKTKETKTLSSQ